MKEFSRKISQQYIIHHSSANYPEKLANIYDPPVQLYIKGDASLMQRNCIAVVGTRRFTSYGDYLTEKLIFELSKYDIVIVSGLAKGIDTLAHKYSLQYGLPTIAVIGSGLGNIYPPENISLAESIITKGLLISEYSAETQALKFHFPQRNRIISGLSLGVVVVEAPQRSGALITAKLALEQGREIFAFPGDIDRENSEGAITLLQKNGAYPITGGNDVIEVLNIKNTLFNKKVPARKKPKTTLIALSLPEIQKKILNTLTKTRPRSLNEINQKANLGIRELLKEISIMEINGLIKTIDGKYIKIC